jgi:hypothetical protein
MIWGGCGAGRRVNRVSIAPAVRFK